MKRFLLICLLFSYACCYSQTEFIEKELMIGDSVTIGTCKGANFNFIDRIQKTRFISDTLTYDKTTGEGFYNYFFTNGDMDAKRLPCSYSKKRYKIIAYEEFEDKNTKQIRRVMFLQLENKNTIAWVELDKATANGEITE